MKKWGNLKMRIWEYEKIQGLENEIWGNKVMRKL